MKVNSAILVLFAMTALAGCRYSGEAMLADHEGHIFYGQVSFDPEGKTGVITFPKTPFGELSGKLALQPTNAGKPAIKLDRIPLQPYSGRATLSNDVTPCLECQITADFTTEGTGDMKMTGCGTCSDKNKKTFDISFN
jgi:hypothetical protein